ncbi:hypothetical protein E2562_030463 [Oryza meyeriana var. granulata]|uniref:Uncharacterized protein n=1 Tax=Oryza meyeriana var. granulata TaxID=110450 RepID=A0A6G1CJG3_9ORYZ|nr:hypothetical protein E2562_030463 [Oryza meyeriana var. granulata]
MALAPTSLRCFITGRPLCTGSTAPVLPPRPTRRPSARLLCRAADEKGSTPSTQGDLQVKLGRLAMVVLAAGVLALGPIDDAMAAKFGGRVDRQAFRSAPRSTDKQLKVNYWFVSNENFITSCLPRPCSFGLCFWVRSGDCRAKDGNKGMRIEDGLAEERMGAIEDRSG